MGKKIKRKNKKFTIMVLPHSNSSPHSINIPMWIVNGLAAFGLVSLVIISYLVYSYGNLELTLNENKELKVINDVQAQEIKVLQKATQEALIKLEEIAETDEKVRELVGLEKSEGNKSSRSQGGEGRDSSSEELNILHNINILTVKEEMLKPKVISTYKSIDNNDRNSIEEVKNNLGIINELLSEQDVVLQKLEEEVKDRLHFLSCLPSSWPLRGRITSDFGWRRNPFNKRSWEFHDGIDIAASYGTSIKAAGDGKVIFAGWKPVYGRTVVVKHGYGYTTQYGHISTILVKAGQDVKKGEVIARVGNTGRSTGPHLDFRIVYNGKWIDPMDILK